MSHLAHVNIAPLCYPPGHPRMAGFIDNIDRINATAARMPGFVWRYDDGGDVALDHRLFGDPSMTFTLSVWENADALQHLVWNTVHEKFFEKCAMWFRPAKTANIVGAAAVRLNEHW